MENIDLSIIIPTYREPFINKTIQSILNNSTTKIEVIPVFDGWKSNELLTDNRIKPIYKRRNQLHKQAS